MLTFKIRGRVAEAETGLGVQGLLVKAYDKDLLFDDLMGTCPSREHGRFEIVSEAEDFRDLLEVKPDIYLRVLDPDGTELFTTLAAVRWNAGREEEFDVRIPRERLGRHAPHRGLRLTDGEGQTRTDFQVGDSLTLSLDGLAPATAYDVSIRDATGPLFTSRLLTDAQGRIEPTVLWPLMGLDDPRGRERWTVDEAIQRWKGTRLRVEVSREGKVATALDADFGRTFDRPLLVSVDPEGRLLSGFVAGERDAAVTGLNLPAEGRVRVYMVPRQREWHPGDAFSPATLASGRPAFADAEVDPRSRRLTARIARARELRPGAYDFIVRPLRYGYEDEEDVRLRATDIVGQRFTTGLVIREEFMFSKFVRGGCINQQQIAGRTIPGQPYFQYADTFQVGENVYAALDPFAVDPTLQGKMAAFYVVPHKSAAQWSADPSLNHLPVLGGNPAVTKLKVQSGCINANKTLVWPAASIPGEYDVIADFGNNTPNLDEFAPDHALHSGIDMVDGYAVTGFRVMPDPTTETSFAHAGSFEYSEATEGSRTVADDQTSSWNVPMRASVYFPADAAGQTTPAGISAAQANYPLVVVVHGNSGATNSYQGYNYLLEHLAKNGFIAASIHCTPGMQGTGRARMLFHHIDTLKAKFGAKAANNIGIMGHSRGGEAVVIACRLNQQQGLGHAINACIPLAPTDQYTFETLAGAWATPLLIIYGAMDGDVNAPQRTGFSLFDRAEGRPKSMAFVYGSTHGRYNTVWGDTDITAVWSSLGPSDLPKLINADAHQKIAKGYMTAFFRQNLRGEPGWEGLFRGEWKPAAVEATGARIYTQCRETAHRVVDDFQDAHTPTSWQTSAIGGAVDDANTLPVDPVENQLKNVDSHSPHDTGGLLLRWDGTADKIVFDIPAGQRNMQNFAAVSFRVTQKFGSGSNPADLPQDFYLTLEDGGGQRRAVRLGRFAEIPYPQVRHNVGYTKSAMRTIRLPLHVYTIKVAGAAPVDLSNVTKLVFEFGIHGAGEVAIDSVEFTA